MQCMQRANPKEIWETPNNTHDHEARESPARHTQRLRAYMVTTVNSMELVPGRGFAKRVTVFPANIALGSTQQFRKTLLEH